MKRKIVIEIDDDASSIVEDTGATLPDGTVVRVDEHFVFYEMGATERFYEMGATERKPLNLLREENGESVYLPLRVLHDGETFECNTFATLRDTISQLFNEFKKNASRLEFHEGGATWQVNGKRGSVPGIIEVTVSTKAFAETGVLQTLSLVTLRGMPVPVAWADDNNTTHYSDDIKLQFNDKVHGDVIVTGYAQISMYLNLTYPVKSPTGNRSNWGLTRMRGKDGFVWNALTLGKHLVPPPVVECDWISGGLG